MKGDKMDNIDIEKAKPILFSTSMVGAILRGNKTQTRRIIKPQPDGRGFRWGNSEGGSWETWHGRKVNDKWCRCEYLYVRESFRLVNIEGIIKAVYKADVEQPRHLFGVKWKPSIHMPKKYARIILKVTKVYPQLLQEISEEDCLKEGMSDDVNPKEMFSHLWCKTYGAYSWEKNPWVWVIEFERVV